MTDLFGGAVSLSVDGSRLAVGAEANDGSGSNSGHVRVFDWDAGAGAWAQVGPDIDGTAAGDRFGVSVNLSADGSRLAVGGTRNDGNGTDAGHVRVFDWDASSSLWVQAGLDIYGEAAGDRFGEAVSLSADGLRLAAGATLNSGTGLTEGHVRVFDWNAGAWVQAGADINGEGSGDRFGGAVSLSSDGLRLAVGASANDDNGADAGHVRVFDWDGVAWVQAGADINGEGSGDQFGTSVSLSADGLRLAVGALANDGNGTDAGHVRVLDWNAGSSTWVQLGADIDGEAEGDHFGEALSLSADGLRLAVGATLNDGSDANSGQVRVYEWDAGAGAWVQISQDIDGEAGNDWFGGKGSVSLSRDGSRLAAGAPQNGGNGALAGHVQVLQPAGDFLAALRLSRCRLRTSALPPDSAEHPRAPQPSY